MIRIVTLLSLTVLLSGCAGPAQRTSAHNNATDCSGQLSNETAMQLDLINTLMDDNKLHAALAHMDNLQTQPLKAKYLRAEILRQLKRDDQAKPLYASLLETCMVGSGHHGLGLIAAQNGDLVEALNHFRQAVTALPIDPRIRNDYGYALLLEGQYDAARDQFITALELEDASGLAQENMVLLLYLTGKPQKAVRLADKFVISAQTLTVIQDRAAEIKNAP